MEGCAAALPAEDEVDESAAETAVGAAAPVVVEASWGLDESMARYEFFIESKSGNWFCDDGPCWTEARVAGVILGVVRGAGGKNWGMP